MADFAAEQYRGDEATISGDGKGRFRKWGRRWPTALPPMLWILTTAIAPSKAIQGCACCLNLLAASEWRGSVSGQEFLTAFIVGYEIGIRAGLIRHALYQTYHSSGSWGAIAAAAATGKVLGLEAEVLRHALGTAEYHAPIAPMMKGIDTPSMGKDSTGWGAMVGLASTLLARRGFTGVEPLFSDTPNPAWVYSLGRQYEVLNLYFKPYAACRWAQPAIAGILEIARQHKVTSAEVAHLRVHTFEAAACLSRRPPRNTEEAQYNLAYPVAAALIDGEVGPRQVTPPRLFDTDILTLAERVEVTIAPEYNAAFPTKPTPMWRSSPTAGASRHRKEAWWEPPDALPNDAELEQKFRWLVKPILGEARTAALVGRFGDSRVEETSVLLELCGSNTN
ncbi:MAG: MmgE/PrpD family protein [Anaerolineae bacterium]